MVDRVYASIGDMLGIREAAGFTGSDVQDEGAAIARLFEPGPAGARRRRAIAGAVARTDHQFNAHGVEVGYRYRRGAVVPDGTAEPVPERDPELYYQPTTWPGSHLPHAWLDDGSGRVSTLDVVARDGFTLFTGIGGDVWAEAAAAASTELGVRIAVRVVGTADGYVDCYGDWYRLAEVEEFGCVLVRPDRHVAWRAAAAGPEHVSHLVGVLRRLVARDPTPAEDASAG